ncbi:MAG: formylglycine-generating enzyme family protein [Leptospirales bacterium]|nr:formylglycine-generating enzyme family protein [Leptospirales bacterium]MCL2155568.1 formylglycine-generating enzyme family protein [Leptospirales bacterium]
MRNYFNTEKIVSIRKIILLIPVLTLAVFLFARSNYGSSGSDFKMVRINGGAFVMGSPDDEPNRGFENIEKQHGVTVSSFSMSKYQITQELYETVMGYNPSYFNSTNHPVERVTWYDALEFCNKLSEKEGLEQVYKITVITRNSNNNITNATIDAVNWKANGYRLPTETEWEYACRAGTETDFNWRNNRINSTQANFKADTNLYNDSLIGEFRAKTTAVGSFAPNAWGLYDMHGNVWEWCWDWHGNYPGDGETDYRGLSDGVFRVMRGGSWVVPGHFLRSAVRGYGDPSFRHYAIGFRIVRLCDKTDLAANQTL